MNVFVDYNMTHFELFDLLLRHSHILMILFMNITKIVNDDSDVYPINRVCVHSTDL